MSQNDSFIEEVSEEVRRDHLFKMARRYGWIAVVAIVGLVGGAAWNEWQKASRTAEARAQGDAVMAALDLAEPAAQIEALGQIGGQAAVVARLLAAAAAVQSGDMAQRAEAGAILQALAEDTRLGPEWRDLAALRLLSVPGAMANPDARQAGLEALAAEGRPYALLAREQLALLALEAGDIDAARNGFAALMVGAQTPAGLRARAGQMMEILGGPVAPETN